MSYILDALRRAESERAKEKAPGLHDPAPAPLPLAGSGARDRTRWPWLLAGGGFALAGVLVWLLFGRPAFAPVSIRRDTPSAPSVSVRPVTTIIAPRPVTTAQSEALPRSPVAPSTQATPQVAPALPQAAPDDARVPTLAELPEPTRRALPPLRFEGAVYSNDPASRLLMLNGQMLREGDTTDGDINVERIKPSSAVLSYRGQRFELTRQ